MIQARFYRGAIAVCLCLSLRAAAQDTDDLQFLDTIPRTRVLGQPQGESGQFPSTSLNQNTLVSPSRSETAASRVGSSVSVITEEQIRRSGQTSVTEVLRGTLGVDIAQSGGAGKFSSVFLRGANSQHTKVLIDGIPVNDPSNAGRSFDFGSLSIDNVERIEVLRGPQSMVYGSDAMGGVINIITKRGDGRPTHRGTMMFGSFGTARGSFQSSGGGNRAYYSISGSYEHTDGISAADSNDGNFERDRYRNGTIAGRFGWTPSDAVNIDYVFRYTNIDLELDSLFGAPTDSFMRVSPANIFYNRVQIQSQMLDGDIQQQFGFSLTNYDRQDNDPAAFFPATQFLGESRTVDWQMNTLLAENNTLIIGADYMQEEASNTFSPNTRSQNIRGIYVQDEFTLCDLWTTTIGSRWDQHSTYGGAATYRATSIFHVPTTETALHGSIGTGFRAPAIAENDPFSPFGNPNLQPERSKGWDFGLQQRIFEGDVVFDVTYFRNDFKDLIVFDPFTFVPFNVGLARTSGLEVGIFTRLDERTNLSTNYTSQNTLDLNRNEPLLRRPADKARFTLSRRMLDDIATINVSMLYTGKRLDRVGTTNVILEDYITVNTSGRILLTERVEWFARVDNLFDTQYQEVFGFGTPGISFYSGVSVFK